MFESIHAASPVVGYRAAQAIDVKLVGSEIIQMGQIDINIQRAITGKGVAVDHADGSVIKAIVGLLTIGIQLDLANQWRVDQAVTGGAVNVVIRAYRGRYGPVEGGYLSITSCGDELQECFDILLHVQRWIVRQDQIEKIFRRG